MKLKIVGLIIVALVMAACNAVENDSTSGSMLEIVSLTGKDLEGKEGSTTVFSDVIFNGSIINDNGSAEVKAAPLDPFLPDTEITSYMSVMVDQIDVEFRRTDGRNIEGVDVPYHFTQPVSMLVSLAASVKIPFVLIRHVAKLEAPLLALRDQSQEFFLELVAVVTIHGKDLGGHRVAPVTGYITVWCGNFPDVKKTGTGSTAK
ncbi:MAG: hypothetical protein NTW95_02605 [Candidatus Aminicenantes bacterium]|nr:hypothetical protein [Candidatus Aminicenantes bacterium]